LSLAMARLCAVRRGGWEAQGLRALGLLLVLLGLPSAPGSNPADNQAFRGPSPSCMLNHNPCPLPAGW